MTDRFHSLTVVLDQDIRDDDAERIIKAIYMIKHVIEVEGNVSNLDHLVASSRIKHELRSKILDLFKDY